MEKRDCGGVQAPAFFRFVAALVVAVALCGDAHGQDALRGKRLYLDAARLVGSGVSCVDCHGGLPGGLFGIGRAANDPAAVERAVNAIPQMTPFRGRLAGNDFADLAAYLGNPSVPSPALRSATSGPASTGGAERLDFGAVTLSASSTSSRWHLVNDGAVGLRLLSGPQLRGEHPQDFQIVATDCEPQKALPSGASCSVDLAFRPAAAAGSRRAAVAITHDWVGGEVAVALVGSVAAASASPPIVGGGGGGGASLGFLVVLATGAALRSRRWVRVGLRPNRRDSSCLAV